MSELLHRIRLAIDILRYGDMFAVGRTVFDGDGVPMRRCTECGIPRRTLRHALRCSAKMCVDPDARRTASVDMFHAPITCPNCETTNVVQVNVPTFEAIAAHLSRSADEAAGGGVVSSRSDGNA